MGVLKLRYLAHRLRAQGDTERGRGSALHGRLRRWPRHVSMLGAMLIGIVIPVGAIVATSNPASATTTITWSTQSSYAVPPGYFASISCGSPTFCVAVGNSGNQGGALFESTDSGSNWTSEPVPSGVTLLNGVSCTSASSCIAVGASSSGYGVILSGPITGSTPWTRESVPTSVTLLRGVSCTSATSCIAVGASSSGYGVILSGPGTGSTPWTSEPVPK